MKTAEEWHDNLYKSRHGQMELITTDEIKQIQLDAYKHGMTEAAEIVDFDALPTSIYKAILTARDNKTKI